MGVGRGGRGLGPPGFWNFTFSDCIFGKKGCFFSFEGEKRNLTACGPPGKILLATSGKIRYFPPLKKIFPTPARFSAFYRVGTCLWRTAPPPVQPMRLVAWQSLVRDDVQTLTSKLWRVTFCAAASFSCCALSGIGIDAADGNDNSLFKKTNKMLYQRSETLSKLPVPDVYGLDGIKCVGETGRRRYPTHRWCTTNSPINRNCG